MLEDILRERAKKLEAYKKIGNPYPARVARDATLAEVAEKFAKFEKSKKSVSLAGRILSLRDQGKIIFASVSDGTGKFQFVFKKEETENFDVVKQTFEAGDFAEATGRVFSTVRGEKSLLAKSARLIVKSLRPLPQEWFGLEDIESRLRQRYLDILLNPEVKETFVKKSLFWNEIRAYSKKAGYLEVETPVLEAVPGGADAEPFKTHHNALDTDFYMRISLELPLKKLLVAGYEKVFELGRIFRNEGVDREHLQDYTQMECYAAYEDYNDMMKFTEGLYKSAIKAVVGSLKTTFGGKTVDWGKKWPKLDYYELFEQETGLDLKKATRDELFQKAKTLGLEPERNLGRGRLIDVIFKKAARPKLWEPCFIINQPIDISPLAKRKEDEPDKVERFQIMAAGTEVGNGFSELNDPIDQRKRFEEQMRLRAEGDKEAQRLDEEFLLALEYGMPPSSGFGMSERLFAVIMDKPVRETVIFPLMKPR
ncbi:MAG: Lysine-tRNA ligase [Candidatus Jorgensenbacteria bacterium GW2011_GWA1_48_13]|uniref:Lysine--tRNA ligase n=2 Tax=Candidatus Joergenseniibacteriota TaxID=1752739 RepID=A0A0G1YJM2_9BACT|nr:MAG: Lysine-tRNA ligase [Candidatus Jorgensenbacteria bacterium GW2011_GWA1_48_13]KKU98931.1 MAG: Lysine-tRNA ligase [Candidatus Jorgensenbacteria bacterium GW2011_GWC1_48_8]KKW15162.1 MAG: Lysine-tRNA ligase [Candidatus Jorgensenbacteria bacterium GW2011_GWB1_50_10]